MSSNINWNIDFNFRNFEVWMANKPLLTNYLTDFELFPELKENTTFYNRDLSDFKEKYGALMYPKASYEFSF